MRFVLGNANGVEVGLISYAAALASFKVPDVGGQMADIVLGFDALDGYLQDKVFMGAIVGRYANRVANAQFSLDGHDYRLSANNGQHTLHGGPNGFFKKRWEVKSATDDSVTFTYLSLDGEEGFPGNLTAEVTYTLNGANDLRLEYRAVTDRPTVVTLTGHAYFNLATPGESENGILDHELLIDGDFFLPSDSTSIPTGEMRPVQGTPFDFRRPTRIGERIGSDDEQINFGHGYDHCWVLRAANKGDLARAAVVREPKSGRALEIWTTEPSIQFYSGNFLDGTFRGKNGRTYPQHSGLCLEPQHFPDSPHHANFPSTVLRPGEEYRSTTIYKVSAT